MPDAWLLDGALVAIYLGFAWLALAMDAHWVQVYGRRPPGPRVPVILRALGAVALLASLALCLAADTIAMAALVWTMALAAGAWAVACTLTWRPRWLRLLAAWAATHNMAE